MFSVVSKSIAWGQAVHMRQARIASPANGCKGIETKGVMPL